MSLNKPEGVVPDDGNVSKEESDLRANGGEDFRALSELTDTRARKNLPFTTWCVYGPPPTKATEDVEDFALMRSNKTPTYHMASFCADDADLVGQFIRGQDHLSNTFERV